VIESVLETVLSLSNPSCAALAFTRQVTVPCAVGVTGIVYVVPEPLSAPLVPPVTVISPAVRPVTASLKVMVNTIGLLLVGEAGPLTTTDGACRSTVNTCPVVNGALPTALPESSLRSVLFARSSRSVPSPLPVFTVTVNRKPLLAETLCTEAPESPVVARLKFEVLSVETVSLNSTR
jgi:hypothetical protein